MTQVVTPEEFLAWVKVASPGDHMTYLTAPYAYGNATAKAARLAYKRGEVALRQQKSLDELGLYDYIATKKPPNILGRTGRHMPNVPVRYGRA